jgi:hypothetical protein
LGKLFTAILNARLNDYTEEFMILKENQSGFRQSYSTLDNIFSKGDRFSPCLTPISQLKYPVV